MTSLQTRDLSRMLADYTALEYILLGDIRDLLEPPVDAESRRWLLAVLDELLETLPQEFELQDHGGYLAEVVEICPHWSKRVEALQQERNALYAKLKQLRHELAHHVSLSDQTNGLTHDLRDWMERLVAFHRNERKLLQTAFNTDIGIGD